MLLESVHWEKPTIIIVFVKVVDPNREKQNGVERKKEKENNNKNVKWKKVKGAAASDRS